MDYIVPLKDAGSKTLDEVGGKALGLGSLIAAGFPVPAGFCVRSGAYRAALESAYAELGAAVSGAEPLAPASLDAASAKARAIVMGAAMPPQVEAGIRLAYDALCDGGRASVAVRSSATAEDLPDLSFAGQQDSYLGVSGADAVVDAVKRCWASLWTARAIGYRARARFAGLPEMAVVVQRMVEARSAGVLFTADPVSGARDRCVIEAVVGLGEDLVSGKATPERFAVRAGELALSPPAGGRTLSAEEALELASIGRAVEESFGSPQDIEWAFDGKGLSLLQSRPITSLYPLPEGGRPCTLLFSFGSWQGFLEPFTPLGADMMLLVVSGVARLLGAKLDPREQSVFRIAGMRLWVELGGLLRYGAGRAFARLFLGSIDPAAAELLNALEAEGALPAVKGRISARAILALLGFAPRIMRRVARNLLFPARGRALLYRKIDRVLRGIEEILAHTSGPQETAAAARRYALRTISSIFPEILGAMVSSQVPFQALMRMSERIPGMREDVLELTRGLPHNVTTEMDLELWSVASAIRADREALAAVKALGAEDLSRAILEGSLSAGAALPIARFLNRYGFRGPGEIDFGRPRWRDDCVPLARALLSYLDIKEGSSDPASLFASGAERAQAAALRIEASARSAKGKRGASAARFLALRARELGGLRESPKFGIVKILGALRAAFLAAGEGLAKTGALSSREDIFFLRLDEIELGAASPRAAEARTSYEREVRRRRIPRLLAGDGSAYFDPPAPVSEADGRSLHGCPVSPGTVIGRARIVLDPGRVSLESGDILVCPGTDPAWTPLFMAAAGLVTVVGGEMTHGSVVAREYGIPAVVGVASATERIPEGARILVDGSRGIVSILEAE